MTSSSDHLFTLYFFFFFFFLHFYHLETSVKACVHCIQQCQIPVDSSSTLLQHSKCHRLLFSNAPFPLGVCECVGEKCNWKFLAIMFLWQLRSTGIIWGTCVCYVAFGRIWVVKDRCFYQSPFEGIECCEVTWRPGKLHIMMSEGCEGFCYLTKFLMNLQ